DDTLRVAKEYCVSLAKEEAGHISALQEKLAAQERRIAGLEQTVASQSQLISEQGERIADLSQRLSEQDRELGELRGLIMNTRHRTLFGAAEWLAGKIRRRGKDD
ncbi:MAG: SlyX family protein, partial [Treponema sp.]|nr:SlyX family protein [Treponema sp.]